MSALNFRLPFCFSIDVEVFRIAVGNLKKFTGITFATVSMFGIDLCFLLLYDTLNLIVKGNK